MRRTEYEQTPVGTSRSGYSLAALGGPGDLLRSLIVSVTDNITGTVSIRDGTGPTIPIVPSGTPAGTYPIPINARSKTGGWSLSTGAGATVVALHSPRFRAAEGEWGPVDLFDLGNEGAAYVLSPANMYTDTAGTTNVSADGDPCGNITDSSGNGYTLVSPSDAARPTYKTDGTYHWIQLDKVDDNYSTTFTNNIVGTMLIGTTKGTIHLEVDIPAGAWSLTPNPAYFSGNTVTDIIIKDGYMTDAELANAKAWLASRGSPVVYTPDATDLISGFRGWGIVTNVIADDWNTAAVTGIVTMVYDCPALTTLAISGWTLTSLVNASNFAIFSSALKTVIVGTAFHNSPCTNYTNAFVNCALDQPSVDAILHSIRTAYETLSLSGGDLGLNGGTNATPSAAGKADADYLRAQGMTVNLNGYPA